MQPSWRSVEKLTGEMEKKMLTLQTNAKQIDGHMEKLEAIRAKDMLYLCPVLFSWRSPRWSW